MMKSSILRLAAAAAVLSQQVHAGMIAVSNFGTNPTGLQMQLYVPAKLAASPAIILAMHGCGGTGTQYAQQTGYNMIAEQKGFLVIYPSTTKDNRCWDVASANSLKNNGGGDSTGLAAMISHTVSTYNADAARIFATGSSSGCMMTNVMAATYPNLIAATSCYSGVAAGCLAGSPGASPSTADPRCASGKIVHTAPEWADIAKEMSPVGYAGSYPRTLLWHGKADTFVSYLNLAEMIKQWSEVLGVGFARNETNTPIQRYTKMVYGDGTRLVAISAEGVGHTVPVRAADDLKWFGIG